MGEKHDFSFYHIIRKVFLDREWISAEHVRARDTPTDKSSTWPYVRWSVGFSSVCDVSNINTIVTLRKQQYKWIFMWEKGNYVNFLIVIFFTNLSNYLFIWLLRDHTNTKNTFIYEIMNFGKDLSTNSIFPLSVGAAAVANVWWLIMEDGQLMIK